MLLKLLKYEWRSTYRVFVPLIVALLASAALARLFDIDQNNTFSFIAILVNLVFGFSAVGMSFFAFFYTVQRFRKNFMTDEAYLTFSVPAKIWQHITVKFLFAFSWYLISVLSIILAVTIRLAGIGEIGAIIDMASEVFSVMLSDMFGINPVSFFLLLILMILCGITFTIFLLYTAIAYGYSLPKLKFLAAVGIFLIGTWVSSGLLSLLSQAIFNAENIRIGALMLFYSIYFLLLSGGLYYLVWNKFRYRLNVE